MAVLRPFTVTIASPAVFTLTAHGFFAGEGIAFATDGALPTGLVAGTVYYVISAGLAANTFEVAATVGGAAINTSGSQSGTHSVLMGRQLSKLTPVKLAHTPTWPTKGRPLPRIVRASIMMPWRVLQFAGGISLISKRT